MTVNNRTHMNIRDRKVWRTQDLCSKMALRSVVTQHFTLNFLIFPRSTPKCPRISQFPPNFLHQPDLGLFVCPEDGTFNFLPFGETVTREQRLQGSPEQTCHWCPATGAEVGSLSAPYLIIMPALSQPELGRKELHPVHNSTGLSAT